MSKEKQIEEIQAVIMKAELEFPKANLPLLDIEVYIAKAIYNAGYRKQSEWISVKDGLPKPNTTVLGYNGEIEVYTYEGRYRWCTDSYVATTRGFKITHWMPIPELPKGE